MRRWTGTLANTHLDKQGEILALGALEAMRDHIKEHLIPMGVEHDPRRPPVGRVLGAEIRELDDGTFALEGEGELFEPGDRIPLEIEGRAIPIIEPNPGEMIIGYDIHFRNESDQELVADLANRIGARARYDIKKAADPIAVLSIVAVAVASAFLAGFVGKMGSDAWDKLKELLTRKPQRAKEQLFVFEFVVHNGEQRIVHRVILTDPTPELLDLLRTNGLESLEQQIPMYMRLADSLRIVVHNYDVNGLKPMFGIRRDGVPVDITNLCDEDQEMPAYT